jgi:hypothetical protein
LEPPRKTLLAPWEVDRPIRNRLLMNANLAGLGERPVVAIAIAPPGWGETLVSTGDHRPRLI